MAIAAAVAWVWSGVETVTASMRLASFSSICRKSAYLAAFAWRLNMCAARPESMSQSATMFWLSQPSMSTCPLPPEPIAAMLSRSFAPNTRRGTTIGKTTALVAATVVFRKSLRRMGETCGVVISQ